MQSRNRFLDEPGMVDLARRMIEDLRKAGISPTELRYLENVLREGNVGEVFLFSSLLKTILNEISPDASQKKLLQVYRNLEECCYAVVELSRNLFDVEVWQHYRASGHESFEQYCEKILGIPAVKIYGLKLIKDQPLPRPKKAGPAELSAWFFDVIEKLVVSETGRSR
jgi:hypothetical protein